MCNTAEVVRYPSLIEGNILYLFVVGELCCRGSEVDSSGEHMCLWPESSDAEVATLWK
jgi:hypothetical protein